MSHPNSPIYDDQWQHNYDIIHQYNVWLLPLYILRPPFSKKSFPVSWVGKRKRQSGGRESFFFSNFISYKLECTEGKSNKNNFYPPGQWTGNDFLFEDGLIIISFLFSYFSFLC